jgi:glucokinase
MSGVWLGIDVGGTHLRLAALTRAHLEGAAPLRPVHKVRWVPHGAAAPTLDDLTEALRTHAPAVLQGASPQGVGMGLAAQLSADGRTVRNAPNLGWRDLPVADPLARALGVPPSHFVVLNDLKAILAGELALGAARGHASVLACWVGTGVGGALALDGQVWRGVGGNAGEIGHIKVPGHQGVCGCGETGCVESLAGGAALTRWLDTHAPPDQATLPAWDRAAAAGDAWATPHHERVAAALGHMLAACLTLTEPSLLLWGGGVFDHAPHLRENALRLARWLTPAVSRATVTVANGTLGDVAGVLGAAAHGMQTNGKRP